MAMCVMAVVGAAPCQCFSPGGNQTTSPGRISSIGPPHRCARPQPAVTMRCLAQRVRVPRGPSARLKRDARRPYAGWCRRVNQRLDPHCAGEILRLPLARGLGATS